VKTAIHLATHPRKTHTHIAHETERAATPVFSEEEDLKKDREMNHRGGCVEKEGVEMEGEK